MVPLSVIPLPSVHLCEFSIKHLQASLSSLGQYIEVMMAASVIWVEMPQYKMTTW